ncbi:MAG: tripartite tricarboxylate transporter substrate binding protein [Burkholderiales bacterium]|nr:tripartite tricarboxylate transporter substrate binding protein [Burkholderiales bacterium]
MTRTLVAMLAALACAAATAQDAYPATPVRLIVPAPPGGANDIIARIVGERLAERLKQPFVIDNRPGATGNIAAEMVARAAPDGYTMHIGNATIYLVNPRIFTKLSFDAEKDTLPAALIAELTNALGVAAASPYRSVRDIVAAAHANPGKLNFGSGGNGTTAHLFGELLKARTGADMVHVPYKGAGAMLTDLVAGRIDFTLENLPAVAPFLKSKQLRALAVTSGERWPLAADLPTMREQGIADFDITSWFALMVPAKTPRAILDRLNEATNAVLREPETIKRLEALGARTLHGDVDRTLAYIRSGSRGWIDAVTAARLKVD